MCGIHMRMKNPRMWNVVIPHVNSAATLIQAIWKGYSVRLWIRLAGKGALKRSLCHNEDEMVTGETSKEVSPFNYFSIEEDGKIWWFDQRTMIEWSQKALDITNPFTRTILRTEDATRLRNLMVMRKKRGIPMVHSTDLPVYNDIEARDIRWMRIVQIMNENGLRDVIHPENLIAMSPIEIRIFIFSMVEDLQVYMLEKGEPDIGSSKRVSYYYWMRSLRNTMHTYLNTIRLSKNLAGTLLVILNDIRNPTELVFFIMKAFLLSLS